MGKILFTCLAGALAGLVAWMISEPFAPTMIIVNPVTGEALRTADDLEWGRNASLLLGGLISGVLGAIYGLQRGGKKHPLVGLVLGLICGALLGHAGLALGTALSNSLFPRFDIELSWRTMPGRILQMTPVGAMLGAAVGISTRSFKQVWVGVLGGAAGGLLAGLSFDAIAVATTPLVQQLRTGNEAGLVARACANVILGGAIGLFVSLARQVAKTAWLRLSLGRNEGKEWVVDAAQTFIGRSEAAHVPLFGDPNIAPMHACITRQGPHFWLQDGGTPGGTRLNGQPVQQAPLFHGAQIGVGGYVLEFLMRPGSAPARAAEQLGGPAFPAAAQHPIPPTIQPSSTPTPSLVALSGPIAGQRFLLMGPLEIGREASGIALPFDATASRRHARVEPVGNGWQVVDLGSTNGTLVNGVKAGQALLKQGDTFQVGAIAFRFE